MGSNLDLQSQLCQMNQIVAVKDDLSEQLNQLNNYVEDLQQTKKIMQMELETAGDYLLESEEKTSKANLTALELLNKLKEADEEIESLKQYIQYLKS
jgi:chromosome segregation ATPase